MPREKGEPAVARPSSSVVLLSPANEVLLLQRVQSSTSYASAHVFPGGNLDAFHDGDVPAPDSPGRHVDGPAYRLAAVRETFEETGILLARRRDDGALVNLPVEQRDAARKAVHANKMSFAEWLASLDAVADTENLMPFTRWITPSGQPKRFTTQMYLYLLPISRAGVPSEMLIPTPDGGVEHTAATFAPAQTFLDCAAKGSIVLLPPQHYLLHLLTRFLGGGGSAPAAEADDARSLEAGPLARVSQRKRLLAWLRRPQTAETEAGRAHRTASIPWADKVIGPVRLMTRRSDGRSVMGLDKPGAELRGSPDRGGDWERVVLVRFGKDGPREVEVRWREDVLREEKEAAAAEESKAKI